MPTDLTKTVEHNNDSYEFQIFKEAFSLTNGNLPLTIIIVLVFMQIKANKKLEQASIDDIKSRLKKVEDKLDGL